MADESTTNTTTSFSAGRRWGIFFSVVISMVAVLALVAMLNYLGSKHYLRFELSKQAANPLSPQTIALLKYVTNEVHVIVYYDKTDPLYYSVVALLDEYHRKNEKISIEKVDYLKDAARAQVIKSIFKLGSADDKNLVVFTNTVNGKKWVVQEGLLAETTMNTSGQVNDKGQILYDRELKAFAGEKWFSAAILSVINTRSLLACFLEGHGEHSINDGGNEGYEKFAEVMIQNNVQPMVIKLHGTNVIPADCNLLVVPGPRDTIPTEELVKINEYLNQGGRMLVMFNFSSLTNGVSTGMEKIMANWNVRVGMDVIQETEAQSGSLLIVSHFNPNHSLVKSLQGSSLSLLLPRSIEPLNVGNQGPETPKVEQLAFSGKTATTGGKSPAGNYSMMMAVEKGTVKGVVPQRGTTAILVVGDSYFLDNLLIDGSDNREFAGFAVNWLLDQTQLLQGVGSHPIKEYKLMMTKGQMARVRLLFLVVVPGSILAFGGLVWFRRRH